MQGVGLSPVPRPRPAPERTLPEKTPVPLRSTELRRDPEETGKSKM